VRELNQREHLLNHELKLKIAAYRECMLVICVRCKLGHERITSDAGISFHVNLDSPGYGVFCEASPIWRMIVEAESKIIEGE
jgi:hypothetical protein